MIISHPHQKQRINLAQVQYYYLDHYTGIGCPGYHIVFIFSEEQRRDDDHRKLHWHFMQSEKTEAEQVLKWIDSLGKEYPEKKKV